MKANSGQIFRLKLGRWLNLLFCGSRPEAYQRLRGVFFQLSMGTKVTKTAFVLLSLLPLSSVNPQNLYAEDEEASLGTELQCSSQVSYRWTKPERESALEVLVDRIEKKATSVEHAQQIMGPEISEAKQKALHLCRKQHENLSGCIAGKFAAMDSVMRRLDFSARKALEEAISKDCAAQQGECGEVQATEVACSSLTPVIKSEDGEKEE